MPMRAVIHIQKMAPGPPAEIASATPAKLPLPTRAARLVQSAWNDVRPPGRGLRLFFRLLCSWRKARN
ncbi:Uncharacterised protein [Leclercia adecarboxylata]|uniref:Uncharacterized protein n=1 Tax=Leclercia adecarboxylata TaxID=83655 RepID=A0A4U9HHY3_9ENTR|nr:Uncharacterised protein [Leclercia adecarboxylata]